MIKWFVGANLADAASSASAIPSGGVEANPIMASGINAIGMEPTLILKVVIAVGIGLVLMKFGKTSWLKWPTAIITLAAISNGLQPLLL